jgi:hypothetical protein
MKRRNCLLSVQDQPTNAVLAQTYMDVCFIRTVSDTIFAMPFLLKPPLVTRGPQFDKLCYRGY